MSTRQDTTPRTDCAIDTNGRITFRLPALAAAARPRLLLRLRPEKGGPEQTVRHLDLEPGTADGRPHAVLEPHPALAEGRWDLYLLPEPEAARQRLRPGLRDLRALVDGHLRDRTSPVAVRVPYVTKDGFLALRTWLRTAHAEVLALDLADWAITVAARLHGAGLHETAMVRLRLRDTGTVHEVRPRIDGDGRGFSFTVGAGDLAGTARHSGRVWDAFVRPAADAPQVRIGRLLDDVADRKHVHVFPALSAEHSVLRPYYTVDNDLAIEQTPTDSPK